MAILKNGTLVERVFDSLYALILSGELTAGQPVSQRELAAKCNSSLGTTAAALRLLEQDGIVISRPRRSGSLIAVITPDDLWGALQLRLAIEQRALMLACEYGTAEDFARLAELGRQADSLATTMREATSAAEFAFHRQLLICSHTETIIRQAGVIRAYMLKECICPALVRYPPTLQMYLETGEPQSNCGHIELAAMISRRDTAAAREFLELHITSALGHPLLAAKAEYSRAMIDKIIHGVPLPDKLCPDEKNNAAALRTSAVSPDKADDASAKE